MPTILSRLCHLQSKDVPLNSEIGSVIAMLSFLRFVRGMVDGNPSVRTLNPTKPSFCCGLAAAVSVDAFFACFVRPVFAILTLYVR